MPATPKNKQAFGFFGNTEVVKVNSDSKFNCKVYTNGVLNQTGILKLEGVKYKNNKADTFTANFNTNLLSLKDRIGNDTLNDITDLDFLISWKANNVFQRLKSTSIISNSGLSLKYYAPLISNNRVLNYNSAETGIDNIAYKTTSNPTSDKVINIGELRPAISFLSIIDMIKSKYNLVINTPIESTTDIIDAYIWANGSNFTKKTSDKLILTKQFSNESPTLHGTSVVNFSDSSIKITKSANVFYIQYRVTFEDLVVGDNNEKAKANIEIINKNTGLKVLDFDFEVSNGNNVLAMKIPMYIFVSNQFEFFTNIKFSKPVFWRYNTSRVLYRNNINDKISSYTNNFTSDATGSYKIDLIKSLPNIKVIDFLTSYFKTFNLSIFDSSPNDENLFLLTPQDINSSGQVYSKLTVDYTRYADVKDVSKSIGNDYNYYNFKLKTSNYKSNVDFKNQFNIEYGQTYYPLIKPQKANEFKVETEFSIIPPILINGTSNIYTAYGFTSDEPSIDDNGLFRYTPNTDELTIFYNHGNLPITDTFGCQNINNSDVLIASELTSYIKTMPYNKNNLNTLAFSILVINGVNYTNSLFQLYYSQMISRLLNPNALSQTYTINLPSSEIYLNDATISAGTGNTPTGFRLQNEIIIGETKFEILEASIDTTTGKTKLTLLNF